MSAAAVLLGAAAGAALTPMLHRLTVGNLRESSPTHPRDVVILLVSAAAVGAAVASWPAELIASGAAVLLLALPAAAVDALEHRVPDRLSLPLAALVALALVIVGIVHGDPAAPLRAVGAGIGWAAALFVLLVVSGHPGPGDVKLALGLGMVLGWLGWPALAAGAIATYLIFAIAALGLIATRQRRRQDNMALAPAMLAATVLVATLTALQA